MTTTKHRTCPYCGQAYQLTEEDLHYMDVDSKDDPEYREFLASGESDCCNRCLPTQLANTLRRIASYGDVD